LNYIISMAIITSYLLYFAYYCTIGHLLSAHYTGQLMIKLANSLSPSEFAPVVDQLG